MLERTSVLFPSITFLFYFLPVFYVGIRAPVERETFGAGN
jgi:hypothetical protein